jgi:hypothetical protein
MTGAWARNTDASGVHAHVHGRRTRRPDRVTGHERKAVEAPPARQPARLRLVVIAEDAAFNEPLLQALADVCDLCALLTVVPPPLSERIRALRSVPLRSVFPSIGRALAFRAIDHRVSRQVERLLPRGRGPLPRAERLPASALEDGSAAARLAETRPDLLLLSGAPILPAQIFTLPRLGTVNVHWGLSTRYRGNHTLLYPLIRREYDALGVTVHQVDRGIDTGRPIAEGQPPLNPADTLTSIWAKTAAVAAQLASGVVRDLGQDPPPDPDDMQGLPRAQRGVLIRSNDRRAWHYVHYAIGRHVLGHQPPSTPGRLVHHRADRQPAGI